MSPPLAATVGPSTYWYLTRATGTMALILLTLSVVLGVIDVERYTTPRTPRFVIDRTHRTVSLLAVAFLVVHIVTAALDSFASIALIDAVVPFAGTYRPFWLGLGAASFDLMADRATARSGHRKRHQDHVDDCDQRRLPGRGPARRLRTRHLRLARAGRTAGRGTRPRRLLRRGNRAVAPERAARRRLGATVRNTHIAPAPGSQQEPAMTLQHHLGRAQR